MEKIKNFINRELEFRAYIPKTHWIYENEKCKGVSGEYCVINDWQDTIYVESVGFYPRDDGIIIVQFAEKKDIEKRELFEADIVKYSTGNENITFFGIGFIKFIDGCYQIVNTNNATMSRLHYEWLSIKHLGNVFQNPEILKTA
jgi:hypothetical protein